MILTVEAHRVFLFKVNYTKNRQECKSYLSCVLYNHGYQNHSACMILHTLAILVVPWCDFFLSVHGDVF
jgi:hypothetical protein